MRERENLLVTQGRVLGALVRRDLRTRFGRTFFGSLIIIGWPLMHLIFLMGAYVVTRAIIPVGTDPVVFIGTGALPYILCFYPARWIMLAVFQNKTLLGLPAVRPTDIIVARAIVEVIAAFWVTAILFVVLYLFGLDVIPHHIDDALMAILATVYLGFAFGFLGSVLYALVRAWMVVQIGMLIVMYVTSGLFFVPSNLPEKLRNIIWYNPLMHAVEWLRSAYYEDYGHGMLSSNYLLWTATVMLFLGLVIERAVRGRLLQQ